MNIEEAYKQLHSLLTIKTTDANPDKDVHGTGHATIHINDEGQRTTHVYDRHGRHTGQLTQSRITQLHHRYTKYKRNHPEDPRTRSRRSLHASCIGTRRGAPEKRAPPGKSK